MLAVRNLLRVHCRQLSTIHRGLEKPVVAPLALFGAKVEVTSPVVSLASIPTVSVDLGLPRSKAPMQDLPAVGNGKIIESPKTNMVDEINEIMNRITDMRLPTGAPSKAGNGGVQAIGMLVRRRKKMKKHKLKKLRKRMKFHWAKLKLRRKIVREKAFQIELKDQIKEAEKFSAEAYVEEKLRKAFEVPLPRYYKGKRLPQFLIKQLLERDKLRREKFLAREERIKRYRNWKL